MQHFFEGFPKRLRMPEAIPQSGKRLRSICTAIAQLLHSVCEPAHRLRSSQNDVAAIAKHLQSDCTIATSQRIKTISQRLHSDCKSERFRNDHRVITNDCYRRDAALTNDFTSIAVTSKALKATAAFGKLLRNIVAIRYRLRSDCKRIAKRFQRFRSDCEVFEALAKPQKRTAAIAKRFRRSYWQRLHSRKRHENAKTPDNFLVTVGDNR
jgi:hypothetical protein